MGMLSGCWVPRTRGEVCAAHGVCEGLPWVCRRDCTPSSEVLSFSSPLAYHFPGLRTEKSVLGLLSVAVTKPLGEGRVYVRLQSILTGSQGVTSRPNLEVGAEAQS